MLSLKPRVRGGFSDRTKKVPISKIIQKDDLDERTRNRIINIIDAIIDNCDKKCKTDGLYNYIYKTIFCVTVDEMPYYNYDKRKTIVEGIKKNWQYYDILSFIEEIVIWYNENFYQDLTKYLMNYLK